MVRNRSKSVHSTLSEALQEVQSIYAALENRPHQNQCKLSGDCCHFKLTGKIPFLTKGEALVAAKTLRATGRKELPKRDDGACRLLNKETTRCLIYQGRPFGCRTHFCQAAGGPYSRAEVIDLIRRLEIIDEQLQGDGPRELHTAVKDALEVL